MKKLFIMLCLGMFVFGCSAIYKCKSNDNNMNVSRQIIERQVENFAEIPSELLNQMGKMGVDSSLILNEYEGKYLNCIFKVNISEFDLVEKKVGFLRCKMELFEDEREWFCRGAKGGVGGMALYIFDAVQKEESGGYDAAIIYWCKRFLTIENVIKRLRNNP